MFSKFARAAVLLAGLPALSLAVVPAMAQSADPLVSSTSVPNPGQSSQMPQPVNSLPVGAGSSVASSSYHGAGHTRRTVRSSNPSRAMSRTRPVPLSN